MEQTKQLLAAWEEQREGKRELIAGWDVDGFIARATALNRGINSNTTGFARAMAEAATGPEELIDNQEFRTAVETREKLMKKSNSRFRNERRLRAWQPPARVGALTFRWTQVRRNVLDIHAGLALEGQSNA